MNGKSENVLIASIIPSKIYFSIRFGMKLYRITSRKSRNAIQLNVYFRLLNISKNKIFNAEAQRLGSSAAQQRQKRQKICCCRYRAAELPS
ncbi:MAG: hypothetical protein FWG57_05055, partial [Endomicrobia bacterium]|nr:hypothetical protein [Endomicrobiia bacterium]